MSKSHILFEQQRQIFKKYSFGQPSGRLDYNCGFKNFLSFKDKSTVSDLPEKKVPLSVIRKQVLEQKASKEIKIPKKEDSKGLISNIYI